jgi:hypothetical protein
MSQGDKGDKGECFCKDFFQIGVFLKIVFRILGELGE